MNKPCFTETSSYSSWPSRPYDGRGSRRLEGTLEATLRTRVSGQAASMLQRSPLRQLRLFEAFQGLFLRFVDVENQRKLRHHENVLDLLVHRAELHLGAPFGVAGVSPDQDAEGDAVHERGLPQVDQELLVPGFGQLPDFGLELVRLLAAQKHSLRGEHRDVADGSD